MRIYHIEQGTLLSALWEWESEVAQLCPTLCDPIDSSPPGPLGFFRQEHWSGLPFPSPRQESKK